MNVRKIGQIAAVAVGALLVSSPEFALEAGGGIDFIELF